MASEIKVDTIVNAGGDNDTGIDLATNDQILLKVANATKLTMNSTGQTTIVGEGGTTTTSVQQGLAKAWFQSSNAAVLQDSHNISGGTDNGTGDYTFAYSNNMNNDKYSCSGHILDSSPRIASVTSTATSSYRVTYNNESNADRDVANANDINGDLA